MDLRARLRKRSISTWVPPDRIPHAGGSKTGVLSVVGVATVLKVIHHHQNRSPDPSVLAGSVVHAAVHAA